MWMKMLGKMKKFQPVEYQVILLRKMQNLRQKDMSVKEYTEEFYKLDIKSRHVDDEVEKVSRYLNGSRTSIQNEISYVKKDSVEEAYQFYLKAEEILAKKHNQRQSGIFQQSRGRTYGEGNRYDSAMQVKGKSEWNEEPTGRRGNYTRGSYASYTRINNGKKRE